MSTGIVFNLDPMCFRSYVTQVVLGKESPPSSIDVGFFEETCLKPAKESCSTDARLPTSLHGSIVGIPIQLYWHEESLHREMS